MTVHNFMFQKGNTSVESGSMFQPWTYQYLLRTCLEFFSKDKLQTNKTKTSITKESTSQALFELGVSKNRGGISPKMDGENHGSKPYEQMDDLGCFPPIFGNSQLKIPCFSTFWKPRWTYEPLLLDCLLEAAIDGLLSHLSLITVITLGWGGVGGGVTFVNLQMSTFPPLPLKQGIWGGELTLLISLGIQSPSKNGNGT